MYLLVLHIVPKDLDDLFGEKSANLLELRCVVFSCLQLI